MNSKTKLNSNRYNQKETPKAKPTNIVFFVVQFVVVFLLLYVFCCFCFLLVERTTTTVDVYFGMLTMAEIFSVVVRSPSLLQMTKAVVQQGVTARFIFDNWIEFNQVMRLKCQRRIFLSFTKLLKGILEKPLLLKRKIFDQKLIIELLEGKQYLKNCERESLVGVIDFSRHVHSTEDLIVLTV